MNDFLSDAGYSPRPQLSPISSPYAESDLSPRRMYSQPRLLSAYAFSFLLTRSNEPRLQRTLSAMTPSSSGSLEMPMNFHGQSSFKRKESLKSSAWQNGDIESYRGHIREMSRDHNGCRALQQCLDEHPEKVVDMIYDEVGNELTELMMDSFGNYLFQKLLDVSTPKQRREVVAMMVGCHVAEEGEEPHRGRLLQRARHAQRAAPHPGVQRAGHGEGHHGRAAREHRQPQLALQRQPRHPALSPAHARRVSRRRLRGGRQELHGGYLSFSRSSQISTHRHGCCVVQRCLDSAPKKYHDMLLDAIVEHSVELICNPFGNYVIQVPSSLSLQPSTSSRRASPASPSVSRAASSARSPSSRDRSTAPTSSRRSSPAPNPPCVAKSSTKSPPRLISANSSTTRYRWRDAASVVRQLRDPEGTEARRQAAAAAASPSHSTLRGGTEQEHRRKTHLEPAERDRPSKFPKLE